MANEYFDTDNPEFNINIEKIKTTDKAHKDTLNDRFQPIVENEAYLKKELEQVKSSSGSQLENLSQSITNIGEKLDTKASQTSIDIANNNINDIKNNTDVKTSTRATQTSVDDIKSIFDNVKLTITNIINNIGVTSDGGGSNTSGTVMAKLNAVLNWFNNTWTTARAGRLDFLDASISSRASTAELTMIKNQTDRIGTSGASVIKSMQKGMLKGSFPRTDPAVSGQSLTVKISEVNVSKCIALASAPSTATDSWNTYFPTVEILDSTTIRCLATSKEATDTTGISFNSYVWQVIEFY